MEYIIKVTENEANLILAALGELPAKTSIDLIIKIKEEVVQQITDKQEETIADES